MMHHNSGKNLRPRGIFFHISDNISLPTQITPFPMRIAFSYVLRAYTRRREACASGRQSIKEAGTQLGELRIIGRNLVGRTMTKIPDGDHALTLFFNSLWKDLARYLTSKCEKCGQERLLSAFDVYSSIRISP